MNKSKKTHDVHVYSPDAKKIGGLNIPMNVSTDMKMTLMYYYLGWRNKVGKWSFEKKKKYAMEISQISEIMPIHLMGRSYDDSNVSDILKNLKLKYFTYENHEFVMHDEAVTYTMTAMRLYALLIYFIDSMSKGLEDQPGFDFIKLARKVVERNKNAKIPSKA